MKPRHIALTFAVAAALYFTLVALSGAASL